MTAFLAATVLASVLGSLHCVGMCGPLAIWATDGRSRGTALVAYHLGRLTTYLSAGLMAGLLGSAITIGGDVAGFQMLASKLAGMLLIGMGLWRIFGLLPRNRLTGTREIKPSKIAGLLSKAKPVLASRGPIGKAYLGGLLTTWLPCGWLYLFVLMAAGAGTVPGAMATMTAFWIGTLPALTAVVVGAGTLMNRSRVVMPMLAAVLLVLTGLYTATGRASADLASMQPPRLGDQPSAQEVWSATNDEPLPCCHPEP
ncbi:sulfite exporter TauE/SafE family protein [Crateriforma spongiae]|uniref:sulfite exporter TauE/SafE family protein n=1 Tax=Crateriforma spongiae TaxID=2724528 RepID=UPI0014463D24|nr:sulfite exporter TauE/SafE family protein [Crateriforma spongiae]